MSRNRQKKEERSSSKEVEWIFMGHTQVIGEISVSEGLMLESFGTETLRVAVCPGTHPQPGSSISRLPAMTSRLSKTAYQPGVVLHIKGTATPLCANLGLNEEILLSAGPCEGYSEPHEHLTDRIENISPETRGV